VNIEWGSRVKEIFSLIGLGLNPCQRRKLGLQWTLTGHGCWPLVDLWTPSLINKGHFWCWGCRWSLSLYFCIIWLTVIYWACTTWTVTIDAKPGIESSEIFSWNSLALSDVVFS
jgi:hypothetical protein